MCINAPALRRLLEFRVRHLSTQHPDAAVRAQAELALSEPTDAAFRELWVKLRVYGNVLLIDEVLIDVGLAVASQTWAGGQRD